MILHSTTICSPVYVNITHSIHNSYLALDKSSNRTSNSLRFCRTPVGPPDPGDDTAAEDISLPTGENSFGFDCKF